VKLTDDELIAALEGEEAQALDGSTGQLAQERADALDRYRGAPLGNEVEGRSQIVDRSVMDTIEWIMPSLTRIYLGGDEIGKFDPRGPEDEEGAQLETDVCNWYLEAKNDSFSQVQSTLRDALLLKNGYMVGIWQTKRDTMVETYIGQTEEEFAMLLQDGEVEVIEHTERPDPVYGVVHDVKVEAKMAEEFVQVESIPPDELIVSRRHRWTSLMDADFVEWVRRNVTIGQLRAEGFEIDDDEPGLDDDSLESTSRDRFENNPFVNRDTSPDPSRRVVTFRDAYYRIDLRGTGMPQLWRIARVDGSKKIALKEEANIVPFAAFSPLVYPHSHIGTSIYDLIADLGVIKTTLQRQLLDGIYLQNSGRVGVDVNKLVNLDDLLVSRPGGIVRFDGPPGESLFPIATPDASNAILGGLEFIESQKEGRTGVTRYSAGLDANTLNKTATGVQAIQQAANQRIELIARTLAGGFKDLFLIMHALASKHCTKQLQIKLKGKWLTVDPRQWKKRTDFSISVGLGTGTPEQQLQKLLMLAPLQQQAMQLGLAGPQEAYNLGTEIWKAAGYKNPERFMKPPQTDPETGQPISPPPQKDPLVQAEEVKAQAQMQLKPMEIQAEMQAAQQKAQNDMTIAQQDAQLKAALEQFKAEKEAELERFKAELQAQVEIQKAQIMAGAQVRSAFKVATGEDPGEVDENGATERERKQDGLIEALHALAQQLARPKQILRGPDGRAVGVQ
jgi:hypothetical protein